MSKSEYKKKPFQVASSIPSHSLPFIRQLKTPRSDGTLCKGKHNSSLAKSYDVPTIQNEYIRNLQQQVYLLEIEVEYLKKNGNQVPHTCACQNEHLLNKIKLGAHEALERDKELRKQIKTITQLEHDKKDVQTQLEQLNESFMEEKKDLLNEIIVLKKQVEKHDLENILQKPEFEKTKSYLESALSSISLSENKMRTLTMKLDEKTSELHSLRVAYNEQSSQLVGVQTDLKQSQEQFYNSPERCNQKIETSLKSELRELRLNIREKELKADRERTLCNKISEDCNNLVKENASISSHVIELQKQLDVACEFKKDGLLRNQTSINEFLTIQEERNRLKRELEVVKDQNNFKEKNCEHIIEKFTKAEELHNKANMEVSQLKNEIINIRRLRSAEFEENIELRSDNRILTDHVSDLREKLCVKAHEIEKLKLECTNLQTQLSNVQAKHRLQTSRNSMPWEEFENIANQMRQFSQNFSPLRASTSLHIDNDASN